MWAGFPVEYRERLLASPMGQIYKELPRETVRRFITYTDAPTAEPTEKEWEEFEHKLFTMARRAAIRRVRKQFKRPSGMPKPPKRTPGRPKRKEEKIRMVQETIAQWLDSGECKTKTEAVKRATTFFHFQSEDTIWRYLRVASQAKRARPRSAKPSTR